MFDQELISQELLDITEEYFYSAINIYLFKPHVVNRKLFGITHCQTCVYQRQDCSTALDVFTLLKDIKSQALLGLERERIVFSLCSKYGLSIEKLSDSPDFNKLKVSSQDKSRGYFVMNRLLPRNLKVFQPLDVVAIIDIGSHSVSFICVQDEENNLTPKIPFTIKLNAQNVAILTSSGVNQDEKSSIWLRDVLFHRCLKWISKLIQQPDQTSSKEDLISLSLINNLEEYNRLYSELKAKYGTEMVKIWPETTDPKKYVYEDVAIATYLLLLWKQERDRAGTDQLQSFVDVGCGNGLLVYILASEGHDGFGIDLRKRKIWDLYPENVQLKVQSIVPSDKFLFPHTDWIIGNHSDELSPWIPVLASRSAFRCRYFLLPCCAFEFDGSKFQRQNSSVSQYTDFLRYVKAISDVCGITTAVDRLKIPSTKRTCLVGSGRVYTEDQFDKYCNEIQAFINSRTNNTTQERTGNWSENFKPRDSVEKVRNCTKVERNVIDEIVRIVFQALISKRRLAEEFPDRNWNAGGTIAIGELVKIIPQEKLSRLKSECGGLQTLLKNNYQIFLVLNGCVQLRIPSKNGENSKTTEELKKKVKKQKNARIVNLKGKACWFHENHPDGCPFEESDCKFKH